MSSIMPDLLMHVLSPTSLPTPGLTGPYVGTSLLWRTSRRDRSALFTSRVHLCTRQPPWECARRLMRLSLLGRLLRPLVELPRDMRHLTMRH